MQLIAVFLLVMFILCIAGELVVYQKVKELLRTGSPSQMRTISLSVTAVRRARTAGSTVDSSPPEGPTAAVTTESEEQFTLNVRHVTSQSISELELEAAQTLKAGILSLTVVVGPFIIFTFTLVVCKLVGSDACRTIAWMAPFFKELIVVHAVYHPIVFLKKSKEFTKAVKDRFDPFH